MKEQLYTIPLIDAFKAGDECPFCYIERDLEHHALEFVLGQESTFMQDDVRAETDAMGFCKKHYQQMFTYGNALGAALIIETHLKKLYGQMQKEMKHYNSTAKVGFMDKLKKDTAGLRDSNNVSKFIHAEEEKCYVCNHMKINYDRYIATFFVLYKKGEPEFMKLVKEGKGLCIHHLADILDAAPMYLNETQQQELRNILFPQMDENIKRVLEELDWFQKKFDYRYKDADWKTSRDALQRTMQKIASGYPADAPFRQK